MAKRLGIIVILFLLLLFSYIEWVAFYTIRLVSPYKAMRQVTVDTNVPTQFQNAILHITIYMAAPFEGKSSSLLGLKFPVGSESFGLDTNMYIDRERLVAIKTNGFEVVFSKNSYQQANGSQISQEYEFSQAEISGQTNMVLFKYGTTTETNIWGWKVVGKFK